MDADSPTFHATPSSKYMTPCRTFGLKKRRLTPKPVDVENKVKPSPDSSESTTQLTRVPRVVFKPLNMQGTPGPRDPLKKRPFSLIQDVKVMSKDVMDVEKDPSFLGIIQRINEKIVQIEKYELSLDQSKTKQLEDLEILCTKWIDACIKVVPELVKVLKDQGSQADLSEVLLAHGVSSIGLNEDDFD